MLKVGLRSTKILNALAKKNLSQNWLAGRIGISSGYMAQLLNKTRNPSPKVRKKFLKHFAGWEFNDLFETPENV